MFLLANFEIWMRLQMKAYLHIQNALCTTVKLNAGIQELRTMTPIAQPIKMKRQQVERGKYY